jgi:hypothetical protein
MYDIARSVSGKSMRPVIGNASQGEYFFTHRVPYDVMAGMEFPLDAKAVEDLIKRHNGIVDSRFGSPYLLRAAIKHIFDFHPDNRVETAISVRAARKIFNGLTDAERASVTSLQSLQALMRGKTAVPTTVIQNGVPKITWSPGDRLTLRTIHRAVPPSFKQSLPTFERERDCVRPTQAVLPRPVNVAHDSGPTWAHAVQRQR